MFTAWIVGPQDGNSRLSGCSQTSTTRPSMDGFPQTNFALTETVAVQQKHIPLVITVPVKMTLIFSSRRTRFVSDSANPSHPNTPNPNPNTAPHSSAFTMKDSAVQT
jgi:hypothetical protein